MHQKRLFPRSGVLTIFFDLWFVPGRRDTNFHIVLCGIKLYQKISRNRLIIVTSDAGSQYRCGRMGRGIQPPSTPQPRSNTQTYTKSIENARFQLDHHDGPTDQPTNRRTDKASYRVASPRLKNNANKLVACGC